MRTSILLTGLLISSYLRVFVGYEHDYFAKFAIFVIFIAFLVMDIMEFAKNMEK